MKPKIKKTLYPLLEAGKITFELLWTLFRSDTIIYTSTYSAPDEPRAFKVQYATKQSSFMKGTWMEISGSYIDWDGKGFGLGSMEVEIESFKGTRPISSLACYPLKYHEQAEETKATLIERGRKFISLGGQHYKSHKGIGFLKKGRRILKVSTNGRVMVDGFTFRRINPNYPISTIKAADPNFLEEDKDSEDEDCCCGDDEDDGNDKAREIVDVDTPKTRTKVVVDKDNNTHFVEVEVDELGNEVQRENVEALDDEDASC